LNLIRAHFGERLVDLSIDDLVQEAPAQERRQLTPTEQRFGKVLGFSPEVLLADRSGAFKKRFKTSSPGFPQAEGFPHLPAKILAQLRSEMLKGAEDLKQVKWSVGHLVGKDGKTPCKEALFLCQGERVILNLYHPDIAKLVALSEKAPNLAGHFATALCLSGDSQNTLLKHIPPERRENLVYLDAICRCGRGNTLFREQSVSSKSPHIISKNLSLQDFLRHVAEDDFRF